MLTTAAQLAGRARQSSTATSGTFGNPRVLLPQHGHRQVRGFRFGRLWASHFGCEHYRDACQGRNKFRYKHPEALSRRFAEGKQSYADDATASLKRMMYDHWYPMEDKAPEGRYRSSRARRCRTPDNSIGIRPGQNIEDAERGPMAHFLFGDRKAWGSPFRNTDRSSETEEAQAKRGHSSRSKGMSSDQLARSTKASDSKEEYDIDPITNRRRLAPPPGFVSAASQTSPELDRKQPILESEEYVSDHLAESPLSAAVPEHDGVLSWEHNGIHWHHNDGVLADQGELGRRSLKPGKTLRKGLNSKDSEDSLAQAITERYDDLHMYRPADVSEAEPSQHRPQKYDDLHTYGAFRYLEPDGKPLIEEQSSSLEAESYQPFRYNEPDGKPMVPEDQQTDPPELGKYEAVRYNEPDGKLPFAEEHNSYDSAELHRYKPVMYNEPDGNPREHVKVSSQYDPAELQRYGPFMHNEPDGRPLSVTEQSRTGLNEMGEYNKPVYHNEPDGYPPAKAASEPDAAEVRKYRNLRWSEPDEMAPAEFLERSYPPMSMNQHEAVRWGEPEDLVREPIRAEPRKLRTLRWSEPDELLPAGSRGYQDLYSKEPQGLETSYADECAGRPTWPTYVKTYGGVETKASPSRGGTETKTAGPFGSKAPTPEPTLYKILAYDPTMQTITIAEATSATTDDSSPLTPAEALLRLSNPVKFLPHFGPLQADGFEIVSGSRDVLVFRKASRAAAEQPVPSADVHKASLSSRVNPIDKTGVLAGMPGPAMGRFASPTGFVSYDLPQFNKGVSSEQSRTVPAGLGVGSEEPVLGGEEAGQQNRRAKKSLPRRVFMGAVWLAGISYSLGVVGEYFRTGGSDGKGPTGL